MEVKNNEEMEDFNKEVRKKIKEVWIDWMTVSTTHALPNMGKTTSQFVRFIWLACFLAAGIYCTYSIILLIIQFFSFEVLVDLRIAYARTVDFPAVKYIKLNLTPSNICYYLS